MTDPILDRRREAVASVRRQQIIEGFAACLARSSYADTTIAEIVRSARVSKATFYEHFSDKEGLYLALHAQVVEQSIGAMATARVGSRGEPRWQDRVRRVNGAYLELMAANPMFLAQMVVEPTVGTSAAQLARRKAFERIAGELASFHAELIEERALAPMPTALWIAGLAGAVELVRIAAAEGPDAVRALDGSLTDLWVRLMTTDPLETGH